MNIIYLLSVVVLITSFLLIKKSKKTLNLLVWIFLMIGILLCFNTFLVYIISFLGIKSTLLTLTIINILISSIFYYFFIRKKERQKYELKKKDIIFSALIVVVLSVICFIRFKDGITYDTTDSAIHYLVAKMFSTIEMQFTVENSRTLFGDFSIFQSMGYVNNGITINVLSFLPKYIAYMVSESITLIIYGLFMYATLRTFFKKEKYSYILAFVLSLMYVGGYPLNSLIIGFSYLDYGVFCINILVLLFLLLEQIEYKKYFIYIFIFLANFSLFFSYYLFVPAIYLSVGLYYIYKWLKKEYKLKQFALIFSTTLLLPFIIGMLTFFIIPNLNSGGLAEMTSGITSEGHIYRSLYANFVLIFPLVLYSIWLHIKNRKLTFEMISFIVIILFAILFLILGINGKVSSYYYYKIYYVIWLLSWVLIAAIGRFEKTEKSILYFSILNILILFCITGLGIEQKIEDKNIYFNYDGARVGETNLNIYGWNGYKLMNSEVVYTYQELKIIENLEKFKDKCLYKNEILITGGYMKKFWFYSISNHSPLLNNDYTGDYYFTEFQIDEWEHDSNRKCMIYFNNDLEINNIDFSNKELLYKNNSGGILIKK